MSSSEPAPPSQQIVERALALGYHAENLPALGQYLRTRQRGMLDASNRIGSNLLLFFEEEEEKRGRHER